MAPPKTVLSKTTSAAPRHQLRLRHQYQRLSHSWYTVTYSVMDATHPLKKPNLSKQATLCLATLQEFGGSLQFTMIQTSAPPARHQGSLKKSMALCSRLSLLRRLRDSWLFFLKKTASRKQLQLVPPKLVHQALVTQGSGGEQTSEPRVVVFYRMLAVILLTCPSLDLIVGARRQWRQHVRPVKWDAQAATSLCAFKLQEDSLAMCVKRKCHSTRY
mmetsp:Transcript_11565/g.20536  ORF Transcript_11565/g.20536 Transcript_11565/m.20536 type:complete len:216 (-) Transcript_11565:871-1518(-)